jgi:hypothetical protein
LKHVSIFVSVLLLGVMLAACGGDADPTATVAPSPPTETPAPAAAEPTATPTVEPAEPTATEVPPTPTAEPTVEPTATATEPAATPTTPPPAPTATAEPTADTAVPTETGNGESDPVVEAALLEMLLTEEELPEEYELFFMGPVGPSDDNLEFCNEPSFSRPDDRLASVEAEYDRDPEVGPFLLQSLTAYPEEIAAEAFDYVRTVTSNCSEWEDEDGLTYRLQVIDLPDYGDESHGLSMTFEIVDGIEAEVRFSLARFGGILMAMGYIVVFDGDFDEFDAITELAVEKIEAAEFRP